MKIGTRSILFGAHQFAIHPWFVAWAWWQLYGFPFDPRLWVAFFVHDLGYWGKPNMDGPEGERHVEFGAAVMTFFFDRKPPNRECQTCGGQVWFYSAELLWEVDTCAACYDDAFHWRDFCLYHSRFYAKKDRRPFSRLCVADKLAICLTPWWLYGTLTRLSGEIREYMARSEQKEGTKYAHSHQYSSDERQWFENMKGYVRRWVEAHKDGRADSWTPEQSKAQR